ncbi:MAG: carboxypeptidase regulatory-like domain-containing protein [Bacteroidetes bacterium]|nr:MAG: carboxypeptidase regulatory-like domain-containing protein [Bacteroidota bacterium]
MSFFFRFKAWFASRILPKLTNFWKKVKEELYNRLAGIVAGIIIALIVLIFGLDALTEWYQECQQRRQHPSREVYFCGRVFQKENTVIKLDSAVVGIFDRPETITYTDTLGRYCIRHKVPPGEQVYDFVVSKPGFEQETYTKIPAPLQNGDTTFHDFQLTKVQFNRLD